MIHTKIETKGYKIQDFIKNFFVAMLGGDRGLILCKKTEGLLMPYVLVWEQQRNSIVHQ